MGERPSQAPCAWKAIRALIRGAQPASLPLVPRGGYAEWEPLIEELCAAHAEGGTQALKDLYLARLDADADLCTYMCAGELADYEWSVAFLLRSKPDDVNYVIDGLFPIGVINFAARPKVGKSFMMIQLVVVACQGGVFLCFQVPRIKVYYLALEDSKNRLIDRLQKVARGMGIDIDADPDWDPSCMISNRCSPVSQQGLERIRQLLAQGYRLIIIDTFSRFLGRGDQMDQQEMTEVTGTLQQMAIEHQAAIVLVDHHRKSARTAVEAAPIDDIMGATAKAGVSDCAIGIYRQHNAKEAQLKLSSRDFGDKDIDLEWDEATFCWRLKHAQSVPAPARLTLREQEVLDAVGELGVATLKQVTEVTGQNKGSVYNRLLRLVERHRLVQVQSERGTTYRLPAAAQPPPPAQPPQLPQPTQPPQPAGDGQDADDECNDDDDPPARGRRAL